MKTLLPNGLVLIFRSRGRIIKPFSSVRPLPLQASSNFPLPDGGNALTTDFILKDGNTYRYYGGDYGLAEVNNRVFQVAGITGLFVGDIWGGVFFNFACAPVINNKTLA